MRQKLETLVLAHDCDDTLIPSGHLIIDAYNREYGTAVGLSALYADDDPWGAATAEEAMRRVDELLRAGILDDVEPFPDAIEYINRMRSEGAEQHLVTGRQSFMEPVTERLLLRFFPGCFQSIEHTNMYASGETAYLKRSKGEVCANIGAHALVDDHVEHGRDVLRAGVERVMIFGHYPWNMHEVRGKGMVHCSSWSDVYREAVNLAQNR